MTNNEFASAFIASQFLRKICGFRKPDLTILFQKVGYNSKTIGFFAFFSLIIMIQKRCQDACTYFGHKVANVCDFLDLLRL